ncbi:hypothetical protein [Neorickettsia findlayensis]|uniref:Uncharacterized protein n=1 Tax=Neorickettsia findlayensis TaxID=2686014 RepID=A0A6P1GA55_9RICK|nr:hypothetical protein [Neorickettsia findlayensis]QHD65103.1 hypothetical protein GP480_01360 [Neorickettsia findlayensis]
MPEDLSCYFPISPRDADSSASSQSCILQASVTFTSLDQVRESGAGVVQQCDVCSNSQESGRERG